MSLQFGFFARLTWWDYSWDIMEPVTYFVGYGSSMLFFAYFVLTRQVNKFTFDLEKFCNFFSVRIIIILMLVIGSISTSLVKWPTRINLMLTSKSP